MRLTFFSFTVLATVLIWLPVQAATVTIEFSGTTSIADGDDIVVDTSAFGLAITATLESSGGGDDISIGSFSADTTDGDVIVDQSAGDLFFSDDFSVTAGSNAVGFAQNVGFSQSNGSFTISGGDFIFEGIFDLVDADATLSDSALGFENGGVLGLVVDSDTDFGRLMGGTGSSILDFGTSSFLEILLPSSLSPGDSLALIDGLDSIIDSPDDVILSNGTDTVILTQDSGNTDLYTGTLDGTEYEFEFDRSNGNGTLSVVPEPATGALFALTGMAFLAWRRRA